MNRRFHVSTENAVATASLLSLSPSQGIRLQLTLDTSMRYRKTRRRKRRWKSRNFGRELVLLLLDGTSLERVLDIDLETVIRCRSRNPNKLLTRNECQTTSFSTPFFKGVQPTRNTIKLILSKRIVLIIVLNQFLFKFQEA